LAFPAAFCLFRLRPSRHQGRARLKDASKSCLVAAELARILFRIRRGMIPSIRNVGGRVRENGQDGI